MAATWDDALVFTAMRRVLNQGYRGADLRADLLAGTVVGIVATPLSMALAIAVGVPPQHGLYTAIVAGAVVAILGGCKFQVTGPTAAFVVILAPIVNKHGLSGLLIAGLMAGIMLVIMGLARMGTLIQYIPYPVTTGFTAGIATVIATLQLKDAMGLKTGPMPDHYIGKLEALWSARTSFSFTELVLALGTFALLKWVPRLTQKVPAPLIVLALVSMVHALVHSVWPQVNAATIGSRFQGGIPSGFPAPAWPWPEGGLTYELVRDLLPSAFAIAMLGAIESLLSAVIADGMTDKRHEPNAELVALGIGNILAPMFGGIAATGAIARTATNIRSGARSPVAAVFHALVILSAMVVLPRLMAFIPMASLAALLTLVAWNMSEVRHFVSLVKSSPRSDVLVLLTCYLLTVFFDMVIAVSVGFVLAAVLFMRRMSELTESTVTLDTSRDEENRPLPPGVIVYEINGPLFFGAAQKAMGALQTVRDTSFRCLIIHLGRVPVIDATGWVALEQVLTRAAKDKKKVILAGPFPKPHSLFENEEFLRKHPHMLMANDLESATKLSSEAV